MNYIYLDIAGSLHTNSPDGPKCVVGVVSCPSTRIPQILLKVPSQASNQVKNYFNRFGEYKFSEMRKAKPRVRELLADTLRELAKEPSILLQAAVIENTEKFEALCCSVLNSGTLNHQNVKVIADKGSLDKYQKVIYLDGSLERQGKTTVMGLTGSENINPDLISQQIGNQTKKIFTIEKYRVFPLEHKNSHDIKGIQIADLVAGAVFRKEARNDPEWYKIIKEKVKIIR